MRWKLSQEDWINVKDRLPEPQEKVIVFFENRYGKKWRTLAEYIPSMYVVEEDYLDPEYSDGFAEYDEENDCFWTPEGWYENQYEPDVNFCLSETITHWMPLPPPPKKHLQSKRRVI